METCRSIMRRPRPPFEADFQDGKLFAWSSRELCIAAAHPLDVRVYGAAADHSSPWDVLAEGGLGRLHRFLGEAAEYKRSRDPFGHDGLVCYWTPETTEDRRLWRIADSIAAFFEAIGSDRVRNVAQFADAPHLHLFMLWIIDRVPEIERVLRQNPALFFGLTVRAKALDSRNAVKLARWAAGMRHSTICQRLGLCSHRILARIYPPHLETSRFLRFVRHIARHKEMRRVAEHLKLIPRQTIAIMAAGLPAFRACRNRVFAQLSEAPNFDDYPAAADDILAMRLIARELGVAIRLPVIQTLKHLEEIAERLRLDTYPRGLRRIMEFLAAELPKAPFESRWLRPIRTIRELRLVGISLGNCLAEGAYDSECLAGESVFYWVEPTLFEPYPVVVQVAPNPSVPEMWHLVTVEGPRHKAPSAPHIEFLRSEVERLQGGSSCEHSLLEGNKS